jgi:hypothetical protein
VQSGTYAAVERQHESLRCLVALGQACRVERDVGKAFHTLFPQKLRLILSMGVSIMHSCRSPTIHREPPMRILTVLCAVALLAMTSFSQEMVTEPSTEKTFPAEITLKQGGTDYTLTLTGTAVRKKMLFKVYGMAAYAQQPSKGSRDEAFKAMMTDGKAKQITMIFVRDVDAPKIRETYLDGLKNNSSKDDFKKIETVANSFVAYFTRDVKENDQFVLRWFPGGTIVAVIQGEEKPAITNELFARTLWSVWFGEDSIVDRDKLVSRIAE